MQIRKYELAISDSSIPLSIPKDSSILSVGCSPQGNHNVVCMWVRVNPELAKNSGLDTMRCFKVLATEQDFPDHWISLGTVVNPPFAWHVFEVVDK